MRLTKEQKACIWLNNIEGIGSVKRSKVLGLVESPYELYANLSILRTKIILTLDQILYEKMLESKSNNDVEAQCAALEKNNIKLITFFDEDYPRPLKEVDYPPILLYCKGDSSILSGDNIGIVGSRTPTKYGKTITEQFTLGLVESGINIVSGLARGIDSIAHRAAIDYGGRTIAVLGSGLDVIYPQENRGLYSEIEKNGAIISEYKLGTRPNAYQFPERNRIISGISRGVLVTEAGKKSGSLITATFAIEQGRELFIVPGNINSKRSEGTNLLLKEAQGAIVTDVNDILETFNYKKLDLVKPTALELDIMEEKVVRALTEENKHFDELLSITNLRIADLNALLVKMELFGIISRLDNNYYGV